MQPASGDLSFHVQEVLREKARDGDAETKSRLADIAADLKVLSDEAALVLRSDIPGLGAHHTTPRLLSWLLLGELSAAERSEISDPLARVTQLLQQASAAPRKCGKIFKSGEIIWHCRTCQSDDTCVLCQECFDGGDHTGHEVAAAAAMRRGRRKERSHKSSRRLSWVARCRRRCRKWRCPRRSWAPRPR